MNWLATPRDFDDAQGMRWSVAFCADTVLRSLEMGSDRAPRAGAEPFAVSSHPGIKYKRLALGRAGEPRGAPSQMGRYGFCLPSRKSSPEISCR